MEKHNPATQEEHNEDEVSNLKKIIQNLSSELNDLKERDKNMSEEHFKLAKNEERLRLLISEVKDYAIFMLDPKGYIISWNEGARRIKGYNADEIIGKHFSIFYPKSDVGRGKLTYEINIAIQDGKYEEEGWRIKKDGTYFWANVIITPVYDENNNLLGFSKITRDLTERRNAEEALRESEEKYRLIISGVKDYAIFMLDTKGRIASWNAGAQRINGYSPEEILGKHFSIFYTREDLDARKPDNELIIATKTGKYEEEGWRVKKDGSTFWANVLITAVYNEKNELIGFSKVTRDLTEKRKADEVLRHKNRQLEMSNIELERYAYIASHDLQEPLRTVASYVQLLELNYGSKLDDQAKEYIKFATAGALRMRELVYALLEYSRVGKERQEFVYVDLNEIVNNIKREVNLNYPDAKIIIHGRLPIVNAIPVYLRQLFQNLIFNAIKFKKSDDVPVIDISAAREGKYWIFSIHDNGIGMKEEYLNRIFEIFQRLHTHNEYAGSGIGLSICKKIVEIHEGSISVKSEPGQGSDFTFTLPIN